MIMATKYHVPQIPLIVYSCSYSFCRIHSASAANTYHNISLNSPTIIGSTGYCRYFGVWLRLIERKDIQSFFFQKSFYFIHKRFQEVQFFVRYQTDVLTQFFCFLSYPFQFPRTKQYTYRIVIFKVVHSFIQLFISAI